MNQHSLTRIIGILLGTVIITFLIGYLIGGSRQAKENTSSENTTKPTNEQVDTSGLRPPTKTTQTRQRPKTVKKRGYWDISDETVLRFKREKDYRDFLDKFSRDGVKIVDSIDALRAVRLRGKGLSALFAGNKDYIGDANTYLVNPKRPGGTGGGVQAGAVPFGRQLLEWLGVADRPLTWGEGITVAVIDSGVEPHSTFAKEITEVDLRENPDAPKGTHGTSTASLIGGSHFQAEGLAPSADLLSYAITDERGITNAFSLADAIIEAVDSGADYINLSLGGGASGVLADAVNYAAANGSLIIASSGNDGRFDVAFPAAYDNVVSVGALDGRGELLDFSNRDESITINAPGFEINSAFPEERIIRFSGTSASAPVVTGTLAALNSLNPDWTPQDTLDFVLLHANESGLEGPDSTYGQNGEIAPFRALNANVSGITDIAIAGVENIPPSGESRTGEMVVVFENRGTEPVANSIATINGDVTNRQFSIPFLKPGDTQSFSFPVSSSIQNRADGFTFSASVENTNGEIDVIRRNNQRTFIQEPPEVPAPTP